ncbi:hypothetical protein IWT25_02311 [Secundilactobacillus pentosiphilus]|uniref:Uncharacterized protein n=1 Tax=Secundilactobacillus pentosiphilus TaxID=1714682 RepID=A0A1Z5IYV5_9LACO|nr:hypothetical protein [Secundilactobacillus pentosiphilus]GAX06963.1 hypothetical protein IWT25_02311 [Secundilactobacillus pentosiphilus]
MTRTEEQQECPYCHDEKTIVGDNDMAAYVMIKINCLFVVPRIIMPGNSTGTGCPINYCPICGRKLGVAE